MFKGDLYDLNCWRSMYPKKRYVKVRRKQQASVELPSLLDCALNGIQGTRPFTRQKFHSEHK